MRFAGWGELNVSTTREIVRGQITSLAISLAAVFLMLIVQFRTLGKSLFAITPLLFTILLNFGAMGWLGIPLDIGTALVSAIAIGIGIDYAIHYLARLNTELQAGAHPAQAIANTMLTSGKAITANALVVGVGFLALTFSQFNPIRQIGWLVSQTLIVSAIATVVLLPALAAFIRPRFIVPEPMDPFAGAVSLPSIGPSHSPSP